MKLQTFPMLGVILAVIAGGCARSNSRQAQTTAHQSVLERCQRADDVVVRFYYNPAINEPNLAPGPLILLPVSSQDPRLGTRPGWSLYITLPELRSILRVLAQSRLEWRESNGPTRLVVDPFGLPQGHHDSMQVAISCPTGSADTDVKAGSVCPLLSKVYRSLTDAKAREAFAHWTGTVTCVVTNPPS